MHFFCPLGHYGQPSALAPWNNKRMHPVWGSLAAAVVPDVQCNGPPFKRHMHNNCLQSRCGIALSLQGEPIKASPITCTRYGKAAATPLRVSSRLRGPNFRSNLTADIASASAKAVPGELHGTPPKPRPPGAHHDPTPPPLCIFAPPLLPVPGTRLPCAPTWNSRRSSSTQVTRAGFSALTDATMPLWGSSPGSQEPDQRASDSMPAYACWPGPHRDYPTSLHGPREGRPWS